VHRYLIRRILQAIPLFIVVTFLSFSLLLLLPGDPVMRTFQPGEEVDREVYEMRKRQLGLDRPVLIQYTMWLGRALQGDFGRSTQTRRPVGGELLTRLPVTLQLAGFAIFFSLLISLPAGIISAVWRNSPLDRVVTLVSVAGVAIPNFWFAIMLILLFSLTLKWLPPVGFVSVLDDPFRAMKHMIMPTTVLALSLAALITRQTRSAMLEVLNQDYVRTARAKGLSERRVILTHALRNALIPVVTIMGLLIGQVFGGSVIVETVFAIPGMGRLLVNSILFQDFLTVQAIVLLLALTVFSANLLTDLAYTFIDPRIRYS
jgi:peptide/nickel transport system permease protein